MVKGSGLVKDKDMLEIFADRKNSEAWAKCGFNQQTRQYGSFGKRKGLYTDLTSIALLPDSEGVAVVDIAGGKVEAWIRLYCLTTDWL